jgi:hypothetical protein
MKIVAFLLLVTLLLCGVAQLICSTVALNTKRQAPNSSDNILFRPALGFVLVFLSLHQMGYEGVVSMPNWLERLFLFTWVASAIFVAIPFPRHS